MVEWLPLTEVALPQAGPRPVGHTALGPVAHADWLTRVAAWQAVLQAHSGHPLALFHDDPLEFAAALWGAWHAGVIPVLAADTQPLTVQRVGAHVRGWVHDLTPQAGNAAPRVPLELQRTSLRIFTSGSTGEPLLVPKSLQQLACEVQALEHIFGAAMGDGPVYTTVSQQHIYGLLYRILWPLAAGRPIYTLNHNRGTTWPPLPRGTLISSPAYLKRLPQPPPQATLAAVFSSGGVLPAEAAQAAQEAWGVAPFEVYGSTETGGVAWRQGRGPWQALPEVALRVQDGHLALRSPHLPDSAWFVTQDRAALEEGALTLLGRSDRIAKVAEKRVSLSGMEQRLRTSPWVQEARAGLLTGHRQAVGMAVVLTPTGLQARAEMGRAALNAALKEVLLQQFEPVTLPRRWRYVDALPADAMGKVTDAALQRLFSSPLPTPDWQRREAAAAEAELEISADLQVFDGHFPGQPVLPGVAQIDWAVSLARQVFALPEQVRRLEAVKFRALVQPPCVARLCLRWDVAKALLTFEWQRDAAVQSSGKIFFEVPHA